MAGPGAGHVFFPLIGDCNIDDLINDFYTHNEFNKCFKLNYFELWSGLNLNMKKRPTTKKYRAISFVFSSYSPDRN